MTHAHGSNLVTEYRHGATSEVRVSSCRVTGLAPAVPWAEDASAGIAPDKTRPSKNLNRLSLKPMPRRTCLRLDWLAHARRLLAASAAQPPGPMSGGPGGPMGRARIILSAECSISDHACIAFSEHRAHRVGPDDLVEGHAVFGHGVHTAA